MAYSAALNTIYNHYLSTYSSMRPSQYDTHKKGELRSVYNSIVKMNKESPLYLVDNSKESHEFAVGLKENARQLRNTIASLGGLGEREILNKKAAYSTDEGVVAAAFIGDYEESTGVEPFDITVSSLASRQINRGTFLPAEEKTALPPDSYSFDLSIADLNYEFQFNVHEGETNVDIQNRLVRLFKNAEIGLSAEVVADGEGNTALQLVSNATGIAPGRENLFNISDDRTSKAAGAVSYLGLDNISQPPSNAEFILNGEKRTALSNHFTVDKMYDLTLNGVSGEEAGPVQVGLKTDMESIKENITSLVNGYNSFVQSSADYLSAHPQSNRFLSEMKSIAGLYRSDMDALGLQVEKDGQIQFADSDKLSDTFLSGGDKSLTAVKDFTNAVLRKANQIALNPMDYVDKKIVAYKNPNRTFVNPYITSAYSGMMFNSYC